VKIKKVFFDANIFNDIFDTKRKNHPGSDRAYIGAIENKITICTSCDIATNVYYITAKYTSRKQALDAVDYLKTSVCIIPFGEEELSLAVDLMLRDENYKDFEDTIQYIMALQSGCDVIVSNDKKFVSTKLPCLSSEEFANRYLPRQ